MANGVKVCKIEPVKKPNYKTSMCIAAFTTCWARLKLYDAMDSVLKQDGALYYCDTDSIIFDNAKLPVGKYDYLGTFKDELGGKHIKHFCTSGAKSYAYLKEDGVEAIKSKGISTKYITYTYNNLLTMVKNYVQNAMIEKSKIPDLLNVGAAIDNLKTFTFKKKDLLISTVLGTKHLKPTLDQKRKIHKNYTSTPFNCL